MALLFEQFTNRLLAGPFEVLVPEAGVAKHSWHSKADKLVGKLSHGRHWSGAEAVAALHRPTRCRFDQGRRDR